MYNVVRLGWDSQFFGYEIGRVNLSNEDSFDYNFVKEAARDYVLIYVFSPIEINCEYLKLVDKKVTWSLSISKMRIDSLFNDNIREFDKETDSYSNLKELALKSGVFSRFFLDKNFVNNEYVKLYLQWLDNSIADSKTKIFIAFDENKLMGFITLENRPDSLAVIGLIAVTEEARGKGIATNLVNTAIKQSIIDENNTLEVITQLDNEAAMNLYKKSNFSIKNISNIYHYWNYDTI